MQLHIDLMEGLGKLWVFDFSVIDGILNIQ